MAIVFFHYAVIKAKSKSGNGELVTAGPNSFKYFKYEIEVTKIFKVMTFSIALVEYRVLCPAVLSYESLTQATMPCFRFR